MNAQQLKRMFDSSKLPVIHFGLKDVGPIAQRGARKLSISGVQPKLSVKLDRKKNELIPVVEGGEFILKPQNPSYANIPENEQCCMDIAEELKVNVPPHGLIPLNDHSLAYVVKRFDRENGAKIHQEDFAQILEETDKYNGSVERICRKLKQISSAPGYDVQLIFELVVLNFILGNGDAHLKNYSISYRDAEDVRLTPAYDIVCSKLVLPEEEDSAIALNGKKNKLKRDDFDLLADHLNIPIKVRYEKFEKKLDLLNKIIKASSLDNQTQQKFMEIVKERISRLKLSL